MTKRFYIIVPYSSPTFSLTGSSGLLSQFFKKTPLPFFKKGTTQNMQTEERDKELEFRNNKIQLYHRVNAVISALKPMGLNAIVLKTPELIELYYNFYNPEKQERVGLKVVSEFEKEMENNFEV